MEKELKEKIGYIDSVRKYCCFTCHHLDMPEDLCFCTKHECTISLIGKCIFWVERKTKNEK
jgi:hypothetical protein